MATNTQKETDLHPQTSTRQMLRTAIAEILSSFYTGVGKIVALEFSHLCNSLQNGSVVGLL